MRGELQAAGCVGATRISGMPDGIMGPLAELTISIAGDKVKISRTDVGGTTRCTATYVGTLAPDDTIQGTETATCPGYFTNKEQNWQGRIVSKVEEPNNHRIDGTLTRDGEITGRLVHTEGVSPGSSGFVQDRRMTLTPDGNTLDISAGSVGGGGTHQLRWRRAAPTPPSTKTTPRPPSDGTVVVAIFENKSSDAVHIFVDGQTFGSDNKLAAGETRRVNVRMTADGRIKFIAGRNGQVLATKIWNGDPSDTNRFPRVTFDARGQFLVVTGLK